MICPCVYPEVLFSFDEQKAPRKHVLGQPIPHVFYFLDQQLQIPKKLKNCLLENTVARQFWKRCFSLSLESSGITLDGTNILSLQLTIYVSVEPYLFYSFHGIFHLMQTALWRPCCYIAVILITKLYKWVQKLIHNFCQYLFQSVDEPTGFKIYVLKQIYIWLLGIRETASQTRQRRHFFLWSKINVSFYPNQSIAVLTILVFGSFTFIKSQCRILYDFDALLFLLRYNLNDKSVTGHVWFIFLFWTLNWCGNNQVTFSQTNSVINADLCFNPQQFFIPDQTS